MPFYLNLLNLKVNQHLYEKTKGKLTLQLKLSVDKSKSIATFTKTKSNYNNFKSTAWQRIWGVTNRMAFL